MDGRNIQLNSEWWFNLQKEVRQTAAKMSVLSLKTEMPKMWQNDHIW